MWQGVEFVRVCVSAELPRDVNMARFFPDLRHGVPYLGQVGKQQYLCVTNSTPFLVTSFEKEVTAARVVRYDIHDL